MKARVLARSIVAAMALALLGCGGGGGQTSTSEGGVTGGGGATADGGGGPDGPVDGGGLDGGAGSGGADGGDVAAQVLPPYVGRIVVTPAALLFTDAGQSATLHAQAFDAKGAPMDATFTFTSARPAEVAVDGTGKVTSMMAVGSTQITVTGAGLTSRPLLVLVVQPRPGTVLVSDAQVVTAPTAVDATADPVAGAQVKVTLDGVGALAAGAMIVSSEGNPIAGQVVSTAPNGAHTDVVYQMVDLLSLFARFRLQAGYDYDLQTAVDDDAIAAMAPAPASPPGTTTTRSAIDSGSPFSCSFSGSATGITYGGSFSVTPDLHLDVAFSADDNDNWIDARMILSGDIAASGKFTVDLTPGAAASFSCKYKWKEFIPPIAGPLSAVLAPRIPVGVKATIKGGATFKPLEFGAQIDHKAHFQFGFDDGVNGMGDVSNLDLGQTTTKPIYKVSDDVFAPVVEISATLGAYTAFNFTAFNFGLADAFVGAKMKYTMTTLVNQVATQNPNLYQLKAPYVDAGPGSDVQKVLALLGPITFTKKYTNEGALIGQSPQGTLTADNKMLNVQVAQPVTFTVSLDPTRTTFLGQSNVSGLHIYRIDATIPSAMTPPEEMKYINGAGPTYTWTWTPKADELKKIYVFFAAVDDELVYALYPGTPAPFVLGKMGTAPTIQLDTVAPLHDWGGTLTLAWTGMGTTTSGGASTESGMESITLVPGMPTPDGMSFDMQATNTTFSGTYAFSEAGAVGACPTERMYKAMGGFTHTGADADKDAHALMLVIPSGGGNATYMLGVPGFSDTVDYTDDTTSVCGVSSHNMGSVLIGATGTSGMGTIPLTAQSFTGGTSYTATDGVGGETMMYNATWSMQRM